MKIKAIIFDLGSVCLKIDWNEIDKKMMEKFGISSLIRTNYNKNINNLYDKSIRGEVPLIKVFEEIIKDKNLNINEIVDYYKEKYKENKKENKELTNLIKKLKTRFKIACLTDTNDVHFQAHEEQGHLDGFDYVFASFKTGKMKKDNGAFEDILKEMNLPPEEVVFVDDNEKNIHNAKSIGMKTVLFKDNQRLIKELNNFGVK
ncbi:HAD-IA family hydrolase [Candidatus Pacearchaeota archaeon]|nr:HAD-IA family hydrolase [Candidatus Pacearchaeota archaeon]